MRDIATVLETAQNLLSRPGAWTQGALARDAQGVEVGTHAPEACCWCATGAVIASMEGYDAGDHDDVWEFEIAVEYLNEALGFRCQTDDLLTEEWNDDLERTHEDVLQMFDRAIKLAQEDS